MSKPEDEALERAIEKTIEAYFPETEGRMVTDFLVVVAVQEMEDGQQTSGTYELFRNGSMAGWKALGLMESAKLHLASRDE